MAASAAVLSGKLMSALSTIRGTTRRGLNLSYSQTYTFLQIRNYAARKGTREKARKKKVKVVVEKKSFVPHSERGQKMITLPISQVRFDDIVKEDVPEDDVWIGKYHKMKVYPLAEAIQCHKETHSPELYNAPNGFIKALIELDMTGPKPSRPVTKFTRIAAVPHAFDHGETRNVAVFCKSPEIQQEAKNAGATIVGGAELVSKIQSGELSVADFDYAIAHPEIMAELVVIKGLMKKKFPTTTQGSLGINIVAMVDKFRHGVKYTGSPHERQHLYGTSDVFFGRLNMETKKLEDNFAAVIQDLNSICPKRPGPFIWRVLITTELSREFLKVNHNLYLPSEKVEIDDAEDDDEEAIALGG